MSRAHARQVMFWPGINTEIADMISKCSTCLEIEAYQKKEPLIFHEVLTRPWLKAGMDSFRSKASHT